MLPRLLNLVWLPFSLVVWRRGDTQMLVSTRSRRVCHHHWRWSYRWWCTNKCVLGTEIESFVGMVHAFNCSSVSPDLHSTIALLLTMCVYVGGAMCVVCKCVEVRSWWQVSSSTILSLMHCGWVSWCNQYVEPSHLASGIHFLCLEQLSRFYVGARDTNSILHVHVTKTLSTELNASSPYYDS